MSNGVLVKFLERRLNSIDDIEYLSFGKILSIREHFVHPLLECLLLVLVEHFYLYSGVLVFEDLVAH